LDPRRLSANVVHLNEFDWRHHDDDEVEIDVNNSADEENDDAAELVDGAVSDEEGQEE
jgi:hypothetical protein